MLRKVRYSPYISNLLRNFYARQRRITLSGDSGSSLVFVVVLSDEQLVGKASGNGEGRATNTGNDNPVTHIPVARGRMVGASWWWRWWAAKRSAVLPKRGWRTLVVVGSDASSNAKLYLTPVPSSTCFPAPSLLALAEPLFGRRRVQPHSVNPVTFACIASCERGIGEEGTIDTPVTVITTPSDNRAYDYYHLASPSQRRDRSRDKSGRRVERWNFIRETACAPCYASLV